MFEAQWLPAGTSIYGPWFQRVDDNLRATVEVLKNVGNTELVVKVYTKESDQAGDGTDASATDTIDFNVTDGWSGIHDETWNGKVKDLVRYRFEAGSGGSGEGLLLRVLPPVWFNAVSVGA